MVSTKDTTPALIKYWEIKNNFRYHNLIAYALKKKHFLTEKDAYAALEGLEQWLACHLHPSASTAPMVMLRGPIALMFDVMNEHGSYEQFCQEFFGGKIIRNEVDVKQRNNLINQDAVPFMCTRLQRAFGSDCVEILNQWFNERQPQILFYTQTDKPLEESY